MRLWSLVLITFMWHGCDVQAVGGKVMSKFDIDRELLPYTSNYLELSNGSRIHYLDEGEGPTLLLLHGNPTWSFLYRHLISELRNEYRLVVPDYPGFGLSSAVGEYGFTAKEQADSMISFVQQMKLSDVTLMVQDWGGPIGFAIAEAEPDLIHAIIIGNTWAWPLERNGQKIFSTLMGGWPGQFAAWCCNGVVRFFMSQGVYKKLSGNELEMYLAPFSQQQSRTPTHIFPAQLWDSSEFLQVVNDGLADLADLPVLITWGLQDFAFQEPERERFETIFSDHKTVLLKRAGHFIQEDAPLEIAEAIREWYPSTIVNQEH
ncbi:MAG: alpha/beta fold hydrolase [Candidatus Thiodiazotropha sp. 6PDIVS]